MKYHTTQIRSRKELLRIFTLLNDELDLHEIWPFVAEDTSPYSMVEFIEDTCYVYRIDTDIMNAVIGTRDPLAVFMVSCGEFYVVNRATTSMATRLKVFNAFCNSIDIPIRAYIPPREKALARICERYGFQHQGNGHYVKIKT